MKCLILDTEEYNKIQQLVDNYKDLRIIEAKWAVPSLDIWEVYFNRELTINEAFELGKQI